MDILDPKLTFTGSLTPLDPARVEKIILHHTASPTATVWDVHEQHLGRGWKGIGYNFMVHRDGKIYEGRGLNVGAHAGADWNPRSIGISCQGYLHDDGSRYTQEMTDAQVDSVAWLCAKFIKQFNLTVQDIIGHAAVMPTACPGNKFRWAEVRSKTEEYLKGVSTMPDKLDRQAHSWEVTGLQWLVEMGYLDAGAHEPQEVMTKGLFGTLMKRMRFAVDGQVTLGQGQVDKAKR